MNKELELLFEKTYKEDKIKFLEDLEKNLNTNKKTFIVTANPEAFTIAEKNTKYMNMLLDKDTVIVPDGVGIVKASKVLNYNIKERIPGIDIAEKLLEYSHKYKKDVFLFGSKSEVINSMKILLREKYFNANLVGAVDGYVEDKDKVFEDILKKEPDIILIALGMPFQEEIIYKHLNKFKKGIFVGVGGSFDVLSGTKKRAPKIFIKLNLEWLYRIAKEPKRIKRFYDYNIKFIFKTYKLRKRIKKDN